MRSWKICLIAIPSKFHLLPIWHLEGSRWYVISPILASVLIVRTLKSTNPSSKFSKEVQENFWISSWKTRRWSNFSTLHVYCILIFAVYDCKRTRVSLANESISKPRKKETRFSLSLPLPSYNYNVASCSNATNRAQNHRLLHDFFSTSLTSLYYFTISRERLGAKRQFRRRSMSFPGNPEISIQAPIFLFPISSSSLPSP